MLPKLTDPFSRDVPFRFNFGAPAPNQQYSNFFSVFVLIPLPLGIIALGVGLKRKTQLYLKTRQPETDGGGVPEKSGSIEALVNAVVAGKASITAEQRATASQMLTALGYSTEREFAAEFPFLDWSQDLPGFPVRVKVNLKRHFVGRLA